jgi:hypothetical protein
MAKRNNVKVGLIRGNHIASKTPKPDLNLYKSQVKRGAMLEKDVNPALIISLVDYPIDVQYGADKIRISPRARLKIADHSKLNKDRLPKGIALKQLPKPELAQPEPAQDESQVNEEKQKRTRRSKKK